MRAVADGPMAAIVPQNAPRASSGASGEDFSSHLRSGGRANRAGPHAADEDARSKSGSAKDAAGDAPDSPDAPKDAAPADSAQWLAAQMLAFKMKEPVDTVQADGSVQTSVVTTVVTLPKAAVEQGAADGGPIMDPQTGLLLKKPGPTSETPVPGQLPVGPAETPPTQTGETPPVETPPVEAPPVDTPPVETPTPPVTVDPASEAPPANPADLPQDPPVVTDPPPTDPGTTDPATVDPTSLDPAVVETPPPADPLPIEGDDLPPAGDDLSLDPASAGTGQSRSAGPVAAQLGVGRASASTSGHADQSGGFSGNGPKDGGTGDAQMTAAPAAPNQSSGVTAPSLQVQLAVPADRQLAPSLGNELASTVQGMSALERVLQATDQAQASTPVLKELNVQLSPPDLGNVSMRLALDGNSLEVHMSVDQGRTRSLIERDRHVITESLAKVGYSISTMTVEQTSAASNSNMSSAGQSFTSNSGYDGSSGRQSNGAGHFGQSQGQGRQGAGFMDGDGGGPVVPARTGTGRGVFV